MQFLQKENMVGGKDLLLDTTGLGLDDPKFDDYKLFPVKTYSKVSNRGSTGWDINYGAVNTFFEMLTVTEQKAICMALLLMHRKIVSFMKTESLHDLANLLKELSDTLVALDAQINMYPKLVEFARNHLPLEDMSNAGRDPQDTPELTFNTDQAIELTGVVLISKIMSPVFGTLMYYLVVQKDVESSLKERHCETIMKDLLDRRCRTLIEKTKYFAKHFIKKDFEENETSICSGITLNTLCTRLFAFLLTRNFVNVDLYRKESNLLKYIKVCIRTSTKNILSGKHNVAIRGDQHRNSGGGDDDAAKSDLEYDSIITTKMADTPLIVESGIERMECNVLSMYNISDRDYKACLKFYRSNPIMVHTFNKWIMHIFAGPYIGGAKSLNLLYSDSIAQIGTLMQLAALNLGHVELAHALTSMPGTAAHDVSTAEDAAIRLKFKASAEFRAVRAYMETSIVSPKASAKRFDQIIANVVDRITTTNFLFNTAPRVWDMLGVDNGNGRTIQFTQDIVKTSCAFVKSVL